MLVSLAFQLIYIFFLFCLLNQLGRPKVTARHESAKLAICPTFGVGGLWEKASKVIYNIFPPKSLMNISYYECFFKYINYYEMLYH